MTRNKAPQKGGRARPAFQASCPPHRGTTWSHGPLCPAGSALPSPCSQQRPSGGRLLGRGLRGLRMWGVAPGWALSPARGGHSDTPGLHAEQGCSASRCLCGFSQLPRAAWPPCSSAAAGRLSDGPGWVPRAADLVPRGRPVPCRFPPSRPRSPTPGLPAAPTGPAVRGEVPGPSLGPHEQHPAPLLARIQLKKGWRPPASPCPRGDVRLAAWAPEPCPLPGARRAGRCVPAGTGVKGAMEEPGQTGGSRPRVGGLWRGRGAGGDDIPCPAC